MTAVFVAVPARAAGPSATLEQCENGKAATPKTCDWVTGNLGPHNSHWAEGDSVPYRLKLGNLSTSGTHTVTIEWDPTKAGKHAFDYLTTFNRTETTADPCDGVSGCTLATSSTAAIPADGNVSGGGVTQIAGVFTIWNGTIVSTSPGYTTSGSYAGDSSTRITLTISASTSSPVISWSGHVASDLDWGANTSASAISGSPYHMRLIEVDGFGGNQDRSMKVAAGPVPGSITIVKQASTEGSRQFSFAASDGLGNFTLVDDGDDASAPFNSMTFDGLTDFYTPTGQNTYDFTETVPTGWQLSSITCSTGAVVTTNVATATVQVRLFEDTHVTCTFNNTNVAPTVSITKTATTTTVPEPGATVTYQLEITNTSAEDVTLYEVDDDTFGLQNTACGVPRTLTAGQTIGCSFDGLASGNAGDTHTNEAKASVRDADGATASATDTADVDVSDVLPSIKVTKTATPSSVTEPGGLVTFVVAIENTSVEAVTIDSLVDSVYGNLAGGSNSKIVTSNCATGGSIAAGATATCSFTANVAGPVGFSETDTVEVQVHDDENNTAKASGSATVTVADAKPVIAVDKSASAATVNAGATVTYTYVVTTPGKESLLNVKVTDDKCSPVSFVGGDTDGDSQLDPGESWSFTCAAALNGDTTNTATAVATDDEGNTATATDTATVDVVETAVAGVVVEKEQARVLGVTVARTGGDFDAWALVGVELIGLGSLLVFLGRRRRTT